MKTQTSQKWTDVIIEQLNSYAQKEKIEILSSFFKTKKGEYGEGDQFIGITVPNNRLVAKAHKDAPIQTIYELLYHPIHECRLCGGLILVEQFKTNKKARDKQQELVTFYLQHHDRFNNWDLVDLTAPQILGAYLLEENNREVLLELATSNELWKQRIAMVSTFTLIKNHQFQEALQLAQLLIHHPHDLIQKAVGWMLREIGKRDLDTELQFLLTDQQYRSMPRTMLRYAIEKFDEPLRQSFLKGTI